jgi:hypothetical protein
MPHYFIEEEQNMAVLEKATNNYYRINFDDCAVRGTRVFVNFHIYNSVTERDKEKERTPKWAEFFQKLRESVNARYTALLAAVEASGHTPEGVMSADGDGMIDAERFPELCILQDNYMELAPFERDIGARLFRYGDNEKPALVIPETVGSELAALGFIEEWITAPVLLDGGAEVYAGDYEGEPISHEFYYNRLKAVMNETEDC